MSNRIVKEQVQMYTVDTQEINIMRTEVTGLQYHDYARVAKNLDIGDRIELIREKMNSHDSHAIACYYEGIKIGYVARENNGILHVLLDKGVQCVGYVVEHNKKASMYKGGGRVMVAVFMEYNFLQEEG